MKILEENLTEARALYLAKIREIEENWHYREVNWKEFYRTLFPEGSFEREGVPDDRKPNGILLIRENEEFGRPYSKTRLVFDDLEILGEYQNQPDIIMSPIGYSGSSRTKKNAYKVYALAVDLDGQNELKYFQDTLHQMDHDIIPPATFTVLSGHGLHLYYVFEEPIPYLPSYYEELQRVKDGLTELVWNGYTSSIKNTSTRKNKQYQPIVQGYRIVGSASKLGPECPIRAWETGKLWSINQILAYYPSNVKSFDEYRPEYAKGKTPLAEAKLLWPEWYERRIVQKKSLNVWINKPDLYYWWLDQIKYGAVEGHRYFCIFTLAIYAIKCNISNEQLRKDAFSLLERFESITGSPDNHFTAADIEAGLRGYRTQAFTCNINYITKISGIIIQKNKRNFRKREDHLKRARALQQIEYPNKEWINKKGRPSKKALVLEWRQNNPDGTMYACQKETGMSKNTIRKYWNMKVDDYMAVEESKSPYSRSLLDFNVKK